MQEIEVWDMLELRFTGKTEGNPFTDYTIKGSFTSNSGNEQKNVAGFYNGNGEYIVRFMPSHEGLYQYKIEGTCFAGIQTGEKTGTFRVTAPSGNNHGPVHVADTFYFTYEDGTPYIELGTTCYAWIHQDVALQEQTLETLRHTPFNKIRFCIFPKHYDYNLYEPYSYPFEGIPCSTAGLNRSNFHTYLPDNPDNHWDFTQFNPQHFLLFEKRIKDFCKLGIEADIILFHPYDRWGFSIMGRETDEFYLKYVMARFSAYRNVWWSLANEYDLCSGKNENDWHFLADVIVKNDPYGRLRSIHNCRKLYDFTEPWVTHCSVQRTSLYDTANMIKRLRNTCQKPVIMDEAGYEGNLNYFWGSLTGRGMVRLFWLAAVRGGFCGHSETILNPTGKLWWSHGGSLYGESLPRLQFLLKIMKEVPGYRLEPAGIKHWDDNSATAAAAAYKNAYYLFYLDEYQPTFCEFQFEKSEVYQVDVIDTWNITLSNAGIHSGCFRIDLPGRQFIAIRITRL